MEIVKYCGAGIQAGVQTAGERTIELPEKIPEPELMLFPSKFYVPLLLTDISIPKTFSLFQKGTNFRFDTGDSQLEIGSAQYMFECEKTIEYFLTAIAVKEEDLYVNLAPGENRLMIADSLNGTKLGLDMLEVDYHLKRLSASLIHPDSETGKAFWKAVFSRSKATCKDANQSFSMFQRVWIVPEKAGIYEWKLDDKRSFKETEDMVSAQVVERYLRIFSEAEYLRNYGNVNKSNVRNTNDLCDSIFKEIIIPVIEKEVNEGKNFATVRQLYNAMILAKWVKEVSDEKFPYWKKYIGSGNPKQLIQTITNITSENHDSASAGNIDAKQQFTLKDLENARREFGDDHQETLEIIVDLANKYRDAGHYEDALKLYKEVFNTRKRILGKENQKTLEAWSAVGMMHLDIGKFETAGWICDKVLEISQRTLGDHHFTYNSMKYLTIALAKLGDNLKVKQLQAEAAKLRARLCDDLKIPENKEYYEKYMEIFENGVFYLVRNEYDPYSQQKITRSYFSGAIDFRTIPLQVVN